MLKAAKAITPTYGSSKGSSQNASGFSLLELLIVLLLLLAAAAIVPPFFSKGLSTSEFKQSVRLVAAGLRKVQSMALASNSEQRFLIDLDARTFIAGKAGKTTQLPKSINLKLKTAISEQIADNAGAIRFFPDGSSTGGSVTLSNDTRAMRVAVNWMTGKVKTEEVQ